MGMMIVGGTRRSSSVSWRMATMRWRGLMRFFFCCLRQIQWNECAQHVSIYWSEAREVQASD